MADLPLSAPRLRAARPARRRRRWTGWGFVAPFLVVFAFGLVAPIGYAIYLSLFREQLIGGNSFAAFENYRRALTDPQFWGSVRRVAIFLAAQVPVMLILALLAALALDSARLRWASLYRLAIFLPYAVPAVVASLMWGFVYGAQFGLVSKLSSALHVGLPDPLAGGWVLASIGNVVTWEFVGYNMLIFYAALRSVPGDLYEAAEIDGAGPVRIARSVKLPALRPAMVVAVVFSIIGSLQLFNEPNILHWLAPDTIPPNFTPNMYAYNLSFSGQEYNYSATIAVVMGVLTMLAAGGVQWLGRRRMA
jgi:multiple sugar transport system permease protein